MALYNASALYEMASIIKNYKNCKDVPCKINIVVNTPALYEMASIIKNHKNCKGVPCKINIFVNTPASYEMGALTKILILYGTPLQFLRFLIMLPLRTR